MARRIARVLSASLLAATLVPAQIQAQTQNWSYYNGFTSLPTIPFAHGPMSATSSAEIWLNLSGSGPNKFTMDTGSTGIVATSTYYNPKNDPTAKQVGMTGAGSVTYGSSGITYNGTWYTTTIGIQQNGGTGSLLGTSQVAVLAANQHCKDKVCTTETKETPIPQLAYLGIGYNRNAPPGPPPPGTNLNAFTSVVPVAAGVSPSTYRQGYVISNTGITLGLSSAVTQNFGIIKVLPDPAKATPTGTPWSTAPMTVLVDKGSTPQVGTLLPDTGIDYMFLTPGPNNQPRATMSCGEDGKRNCAVAGTRIDIWLPGQTGTAASFIYIAPDPKDVDKKPPAGRVEMQDPENLPAFINTGRQFYENFTYFYDDVGGFVGYSATPNAAWAATFSPVLSLTGSLTLTTNFQAAMPVYLAGGTSLQTASVATFNGAITGTNNSGLTLGGGGAYTFNAAVNLGGGAFSLQQGSASINAGLSAASIGVSALGTLTNNAGSTIVGNVLNAGIVSNNGVVKGTFNNSGLLSGNGTIVGDVVNAGTISPGNSVGTITIAGNYTVMAGSHFAEVSGSGLRDLISVSGTAALLGGTVNVAAVPGAPFAARTTFTILSAAAGLTGTYAAVVDPYPFLQSSLSYDANNVYLTLVPGGFAAAAQTRTQYAVGTVLDANVNTATGDFATIIGTLATQQTSQVLPFMTSISGQNYSAFSSSMVQGAALFMNNFANQTGGGGSPASNRVALAEACDVACDAASAPLWGAWGGALGGLGVIGANAATGGVTYNAGGFAAGLDRLVAPGVRVGVTTGYTTGTQWTSGFSGNGTTDTFLAGLYGNYREGKVYADAVLGYAYSYNQMWRQISIPTMQQRLAQGRTGANQFYGQLEGGYRFDIGPVGSVAADAYITPFARLQGYTGTQNGFTETGAQSLNLTVAGQTTNSLRSVIGAQLGGAIDLGWREKLALQFRLGWSHEYANTARPVTATLGGAPLMPFTTYGIAPQRDGVVLGFSANTAIAEATSVYLRYEGNVSGQDSAHALTAGVRMTW